MAEDIDPFGFRFALEQSIAVADYTTKESAALHLLRRYAQMLDEQPSLIPSLGPKYFTALATMNLVPVRDVRATPKGSEAKANDEPKPESPQAVALRGLRLVHGPHTRSGAISA